VSLCECGCGGTPKAYRGVPYRYLFGHHNIGKGKPRGPSKTTRYTVDPETGCWTWLLATSGKYGSTHLDGKGLGAHRAEYIKRHGPIPDGLELDHLCRNTLCVNPDHLEPVTKAVNVRRSTCTILTEADVLVMRSRYRTEDVSIAQIGRDFGVSRPCASEAVHGRTRWKNLA